VVLAALRRTRTFAAVDSVRLVARDAETVTAIILASPDSTWASLPVPARAELADLLERDRSVPALAAEIAQLREQLEAFIGIEAGSR
jgi:hypothetical protein